MSSDQLANLFAKMFISRKDVKAIQHASGAYTPHVSDPRHPEENRIPWSRADLVSHIEGRQVFGHYLLDRDSNCKLMAFDIDLRKTGWLPVEDPIEKPEGGLSNFIETQDLRAEWQDHRKNAYQQRWMRLQFRLIANKIARSISEELDLPVAVAYSGSKGIHVYGFTGLMPAAQVRKGAEIVLQAIGEFELEKGQHIWRHKDSSPFDGFPNLSVEVFPKQDSLDGKDLGNLMRLPLGKNHKTPDKTFFIDMTAALNEFKPLDPIWALTDGALNPWKKQGE